MAKGGRRWRTLVPRSHCRLRGRGPPVRARALPHESPVPDCVPRVHGARMAIYGHPFCGPAVTLGIPLRFPLKAPIGPCKPRFVNMHSTAAPIRYISQPQFSSRIVHFGHPGSKILNLFISFFQFFFFQLNFEKAIHNWEPYLSRRDGYIPEPICIVRSVPEWACLQMTHCRATQGTIGVPTGTTTANHSTLPAIPTCTFGG